MGVLRCCESYCEANEPPPAHRAISISLMIGELIVRMIRSGYRSLRDATANESRGAFSYYKSVLRGILLVCAHKVKYIEPRCQNVFFLQN